MRNKKYLILIGFVTALLFGSCVDSADYKVRYSGTLRRMMFGDLMATISLDTLKHKQNLYAIGAVDNLKGEIQIFKGNPLNTSVDSDEIVLDRTFNKNAALLVYAEVENWQTVEIPKKMTTSKELEEFIERKAKEKGMNMEKPFPFLITGKANSLKWHVIDWVEDDTVHTHQKHQESGLNGVLNDKDVEIIGFYSKSHKAVFTHHTTFVHMHFKDEEEQIAGHVDELLLGTNMELKLPKI